MAIMFVRTLLAARLLDVSEFGMFGIGMLVSNSFCMLGCLGFYMLLQRDLPMLIAKGQGRRGLIIMNQTLLLTAGSFVGLLPLSFAGLFSVTSSFFVVSLLNGFAQQVFLVVTLHSRSHGRSIRFAVDNLLRSIGVVVAIGLGAWLTGSALLMLLVEASVTLVMSVWIYAVIQREAPTKLAGLLRVSIRSIRNIRWVSPFTLLAASVAGFLMLNGDRWLAASLLSHEDFAMYAFAGIVLLLAQSMQSVINVSVFPHLAQTYAVVGKASAGFKAIRFSILALNIFILLSAIAYFPVGYAIEVFFPKFAGARELVAFFLAVAALRMSDFLTSYLIISGQERQLLIINILTIIISFVIWFVYSGFDLSEIRPVSIAWLAVLMAALSYLGCLLAVIISLRSWR